MIHPPETIEELDSKWSTPTAVTLLSPPTPDEMHEAAPIHLPENLHFYLCLLSEIDDDITAWPKAILVYNMAVEPRLKNKDLARIRAAVLLDAGY